MAMVGMIRAREILPFLGALLLSSPSSSRPLPLLQKGQARVLETSTDPHAPTPSSLPSCPGPSHWEGS